MNSTKNSLVRGGLRIRYLSHCLTLSFIYLWSSLKEVWTSFSSDLHPNSWLVKMSSRNKQPHCINAKCWDKSKPATKQTAFLWELLETRSSFTWWHFLHCLRLWTTIFSTFTLLLTVFPFILHQCVCLFTNLHCVRYGQARIGWRYLIVHEDNEKCYTSDKRDADEVQADSQPSHCATEEVVGGLVGVQ